MAVKNEIDITINEDGTVNLSVKGVEGKSCLDITKFLEEELGVVTERQHTSEYYEVEDVKKELKIVK